MTKKRTRDIWEFMRQNAQAPRQHSLWFDVGGSMKVYFRAGGSYFSVSGLPLHAGVAISSVEVDEAEQGKGVFRAFLEKTEALAASLGYQSIRVEQVHNPILQDMLTRRGWSSQDEGGVFTFYKVLELPDAPTA